MNVERNSADHRLMVRVGRLHHEMGMRQTEIAQKLNMSAAKVSRLLKRAEEENIIRTVVTPMEGCYPELEEALEERYDLGEVVIVDVDGDAREVLPALTVAGANFIQRSLTVPSVLGISAWSETLMGVSMNLQASGRSSATAVVQLVGGSGPPNSQMASAEMIARFARALGGLPIMVPAPGVAGTPDLRRAIMGDPTVAEATAYWTKVEVALIGIGGLDPSPALRRSGNYSPEEAERFMALGSVGDICLRHFDRDGQFIRSAYDDQIIGIPPVDLLKIRHRVGVAGGTEKAEAIAGALKGRMLTTLITDVGTARHILDQ